MPARLAQPCTLRGTPEGRATTLSRTRNPFITVTAHFRRNHSFYPAPRVSIVLSIMGELLTLELEQKAASVRAQLAAAVQEYGRVVYSNSLGAEAMVLTDIIWTHVPAIDIFSIDTGRLHEETYEVLEKLQRRYKRNVRVVYPDAQALEALVSAQGVNGFY